MPRYHVFANGLISVPNDLATMSEALERFEAEKAALKHKPRAMVTLRKSGCSRRLRRWEVN